ncbi:hypothetical protein TrVE_jg11456 [Triparma verrucosa]|uniref:JmjC domain-containing protein n=1 Tax=Triparma verrucosa TaxID=1606542 RepID=A0A9W7C9C0_9STRA|nr:hypothetical protein TrVE_jg11456 [Triparma verrucosa]
MASSAGGSSKSLSLLVYNIWTRDGSDDSALAPKFLDGGIDALGLLMYLRSGEELDLGEEEEDYEEDYAAIEREQASELSYERFVEKYMAPNQPVIITGLTESWRATTELLDGEGASLDVDRLEEEYGECTAPVHVSDVPKGHPFGGLSRPATEEMTVAAYCEYWRDRRPSSPESPNETYLYLKDWKPHAILKKVPMYSCPAYFKEDWLNDLNGSYKFVYLGPANTCTRLHADVLRSYSWSSNVTGRKRWYLIPPEHTYMLFDVFGKALAPHIHFDLESELNAVMFPGLRLARRHAVFVDQVKGETIFVPSGWHHSVENLEDTLSINHNWLNGFNLEGSWRKLKDEILNERDHMKTARNVEGIEQEFRAGTEGVGGGGRMEDESQNKKDLVLLYELLAHQLEINSKLRDRELQSIVEILEGMIELVGNGKGSESESDYRDEYAGVRRSTDWRPEDLLMVVKQEQGVG